MPESRDRLARPVDVSLLLPNAGRRVGLMVDEPGLSSGIVGTPVRVRAQLSPGSGRWRGNGSPVTGLGVGRGLRRSPVARGSSGWRVMGRGRGRSRGRSGLLPSWYPRTPLRDITAVARAIERRRAQLNDVDADVTAVPQQQRETSTSNAHLDKSLTTPLPATFKGDPQSSPASQVWRIMAKIGDENGKGDDSTPQKKLLNSIEKVREAWLDEQRKMESTPCAKRADRAKKVKTLMSMR